MENKELLQSIAKRLGVLIALQLHAQSEKFSTTDGVQLLTRFGLNAPEIAEILNTSANVVNVMKSRMKGNKK
jgi:hypothetical protein